MIHDAFCRCRACKPPLEPGQTVADYRALQRLKLALVIMSALVAVVLIVRHT